MAPPEACSQCERLGRLRIAAKLVWAGSVPGPREAPCLNPHTGQLCDEPVIALRVYDTRYFVWGTAIPGSLLTDELRDHLLTAPTPSEWEWAYFSLGYLWSPE